MSQLIYFSAAEQLKGRHFELSVPAFYHPSITREEMNAIRKPLERVNRFKPVATRQRNPLPFRQVIDPNQWQRASYSTEVMLDMHQKQIEFVIVNDDDIPVIFDGLDWYLESIRPNVELGLEVFVEYAKLVLSFREMMYHFYYRYMMTHPVVKESLYPNNSVTNNLAHLMILGGGIRKEQMEQLDPLRAKGRPPYTLEEALPKEKEEVTESTDIEGSLPFGGAQSIIDQDDFNFSDFLGKGK